MTMPRTSHGSSIGPWVAWRDTSRLLRRFANGGGVPVWVTRHPSNPTPIMIVKVIALVAVASRHAQDNLHRLNPFANNAVNDAPLAPTPPASVGV